MNRSTVCGGGGSDILTGDICCYALQWGMRWWWPMRTMQSTYY